MLLALCNEALPKKQSQSKGKIYQKGIEQGQIIKRKKLINNNNNNNNKDNSNNNNIINNHKNKPTNNKNKPTVINTNNDND